MKQKEKSTWGGKRPNSGAKKKLIKRCIIRFSVYPHNAKEIKDKFKPLIKEIDLPENNLNK